MGVLPWLNVERELSQRAAARFARLPLADLAIEALELKRHALDERNPQLERTRSRHRIALIRVEVALRQRRGEA